MARAPFKMKSGNSPLFKQMGSSPARLVDFDTESAESIKPPKKKETNKPYVKPGGKATGSMKDYAHGSKERYAEYEARGWKHDATTKGGKPEKVVPEKKVVKEVVKPKNGDKKVVVKEVDTGAKTLTKKETKAKTVPKTLVGNIGRGISNWAASQAGTAKDRASFVPKPTRKSVKKQIIKQGVEAGLTKKEAKATYKTAKKSVKKEQKVAKLKKQKKDAEGGKTKFWQFRSNKEKAANRAKRISKLEKK